jgi:hypothetical protein
MVGDGHTVGEARQVFEHAAWSTEGRLDVNQPVGRAGFSHQAAKATASESDVSSPQKRSAPFRKARRRGRRKDFWKRVLSRRTGRKKDDLRHPIQRESQTMDIAKVLVELRQERDGIDEAIAVLARLAAGQGKRRGRTPAWMNMVKMRGRPAGEQEQAERITRLSVRPRVFGALWLWPGGKSSF